MKSEKIAGHAQNVLMLGLLVALIVLAVDLIPKEYLEMRANILAAYSLDGDLRRTIPETADPAIESGSPNFVDSRFGRALRVGRGKSASLNLPGPWNLSETGMISFWIKPDRDAGIGRFERILTVPDASFSLHKDAHGRLVFRIGTKVVAMPARWAAGHWNHIAVGWGRMSAFSEGSMELYLNGRRAELVFGPGDGRFPASTADMRLTISSAGEGGFAGAIDEVILFNRLLNAREVRSVFGHVLSAVDVSRVKDLPLIAEPENLTYGKPVTASSPPKSPYYGYERVTDGVLYEAMYATNAPDGEGQQWVQVDLGQVRTINEITLWHGASGGYPYNVLEVSAEPDFTGEQVVIFDSRQEGPYEETADGRVFRFDPVEARYIRNTIEGDVITGRNRWVEIRAIHDPLFYPPREFPRRGEWEIPPAPIEPDRAVEYFVPPAFRFIDGESLPLPAWLGRKVAVTAAGGETAVANVAVRAKKTHRNVRVQVTRPVGNGTAWPEDPEVFVVKVRERPPGGSRAAEPFPLPELLLKDDRVNLKNVFNTTGDFPEVRLGGAVETDLRAEVTKQFWLAIPVKPGTPPGAYRAEIRLRSPDGMSLNVPVELEVLPFDLERPGHRFWGIYFQLEPSDVPRAKLDEKRRAQEYPVFHWDVYRRYLDDVRAHGFDVLALLSPVNKMFSGRFERSLLAARDTGFTRGIVVLPDPWAYRSDPTEKQGGMDLAQYVRELRAFQAKNKLPRPVLYEEDEPSQPGHARDMEARRPAIVENGGYTMTAINGGHLDPFVDRVDYPVILPGDPLKARDAAQNLRDRDKHPWYYYQIWALTPEPARQFAGYGFWIRNFDGILPYTYMRVYGDPYDDSDGKDKEFCMAYPTKQGPVGTLAWEATREGIDDFRYVHTFTEKAMSVWQMCREDENCLDETERAMDEVWAAVLRQVRREKGHDFQADRAAVAEAIMTLVRLERARR